MIRAGVLTLLIGLALVPASLIGSNQAEAQAPLTLLVATDEPSYRAGSGLVVTLAVHNPGQTDVTLTFPSAQVYDVVVYRGADEVWRWSGNQGFAQVLIDRSFPPGLTPLGQVTWDWRDGSGRPLPPDVYRLQGRLATSPPQVGNVLELILAAP